MMRQGLGESNSRGRYFHRTPPRPPRERSPVQKILRNRFEDLEATADSMGNQKNSPASRGRNTWRPMRGTNHPSSRLPAPEPLLSKGMQNTMMLGFPGRNPQNHRPPPPVSPWQSNAFRLAGDTSNNNNSSAHPYWQSSGNPFQSKDSPAMKVPRLEAASPWEVGARPQSPFVNSGTQGRSSLLKPQYLVNHGDSRPSSSLAGNQNQQFSYGGGGPGPGPNPFMMPGMGMLPMSCIAPPPPLPPPYSVTAPPLPPPLPPSGFAPTIAAASGTQSSVSNPMSPASVSVLHVAPPASQNDGRPPVCESLPVRHEGHPPMPNSSFQDAKIPESRQAHPTHLLSSEPNRNQDTLIVPPTLPKSNADEKPSEPTSTAGLLDKNLGVSNELKFIEMTAKFGFEVKCSPNIKIIEDKKFYYFKIELCRRGVTVVAIGPLSEKIDEARELAYEIACGKALESFGSDPKSDNGDFQREESVPLTPANVNHVKKDALLPTPDGASELGKICTPRLGDEASQPKFSVQETPKSHSNNGLKSSGFDTMRNPLLPTPQLGRKDPLLSTPKLPREELTDYLSPVHRRYEDRFKDYMDALHMQCWLKFSQRTERGTKLLGVEVEVQSYDRKFHEFYIGAYKDTDDMAKESAFEMACKGLEKRFPQQLQRVAREAPAPNQRAFLDLRSALGLKLRVLREGKYDSHQKQTYAYNIEFWRDDEEDPEVVYGEFSQNEVQAKERAFELATQRVKYLYGPELEQLERRRGVCPVPNTSTAERNRQEAPVRSERLFNPHSINARKSTLAMVPPLIHPPRSRTPIPTDSPPEFPRAEYGRTHEYRFKELASLLSMEFNVRKIPQFEGGHRIFAFEVSFQGKSGRFGPQKVMGEYSRDEGSAKENAFKYASDQLSSTYGYQLSQLGLNPQGSFASF